MRAKHTHARARARAKHTFTHARGPSIHTRARGPSVHSHKHAGQAYTQKNRKLEVLISNTYDAESVDILFATFLSLVVNSY